MEEKLEYLTRIFTLAKKKGLCKTKGEFAALIGMNQSTISMAFNESPRYLTDNLIRRIKVWADETFDGEELRDPSDPGPSGKNVNGLWIPLETVKLFENLSETCRILAERVPPANHPNAFGIYQPPKNQPTKH